MNFKFFLIMLVIGFIPSMSRSGTPLGTFGDWEAYTEIEGGNLVCVIGSYPIKEQGKYKIRGKTYILVTHRPKLKENNVVMVAAGYPYKKNSTSQITIGKITFELFTDSQFAFAPKEQTDKLLIKSMIKGTIMTVKGRSSRNTLTTDTYSLKGFTAAYNKINKACKL